MRIAIEFCFNDEDTPAAVTGVEGDVSDILLPMVGDLVSHSGSGRSFSGRVSERHFTYSVGEGVNVGGSVTVTLSLNRVTLH